MRRGLKSNHVEREGDEDGVFFSNECANPSSLPPLGVCGRCCCQLFVPTVPALAAGWLGRAALRPRRRRPGCHWGRGAALVLSYVLQDVALDVLKLV